MAAFASLQDYLANWAAGDAQRGAVSATVLSLAVAGVDIAGVIAKGPLIGQMSAVRGAHADGDTQKQLDFVTNEMITKALRASPVAFMGSEEEDQPIPLNAGAPLAVNVDPLDGSSNIDANVSIGTIFSVLPANAPQPLLQPGSAQLAAGFVVYGPQTAVVLTVGAGTQIFYLDRDAGEWLLGRPNVIVPPSFREYAVNSSNARHWDSNVRAYIGDIERGADGPRGGDYNMRWVGSLVGDAFRILTRGGVYVYPGDARKGYAKGRLRLLYEANPLAMVMEQAGAACTDGERRIMDIQPETLHQRTPLVFGSTEEVAEAARYFSLPPAGEISPLFAERGLFRT